MEWGMSLPGVARSTDARSRKAQKVMVGQLLTQPPHPLYAVWPPHNVTLTGPASHVSHLSRSLGLPQTQIPTSAEEGEDGFF